MAQPGMLTGGRERATRLAMKLAGAVHRRLYGATGGRIGRAVGGMPVLLLTTTGRKSVPATTTAIAMGLLIAPCITS